MYMNKFMGRTKSFLDAVDAILCWMWNRELEQQHKHINPLIVYFDVKSQTNRNISTSTCARHSHRQFLSASRLSHTDTYTWMRHTNPNRDILTEPKPLLSICDNNKHKTTSHSKHFNKIFYCNKIRENSVLSDKKKHNHSERRIEN